MRTFILLALKAHTSDFSLDKLPESGRMDLVCRTVSNAFSVANAIRQDTVVHACLSGPSAPPKIVTFIGAELKEFHPDERTIGQFIKKALAAGKTLALGEEKEAAPGVRVSKKAFETLIQEPKGQLCYLHPKGEDVRKAAFPEDVTFVLGDNKGLPKKTERLLDRLGAKKITLGPVLLYASHCSILVHNELDRKIFKRKAL